MGPDDVVNKLKIAHEAVNTVQKHFNEIGVQDYPKLIRIANDLSELRKEIDRALAANDGPEFIDGDPGLIVDR